MTEIEDEVDWSDGTLHSTPLPPFQPPGGGFGNDDPSTRSEAPAQAPLDKLEKSPARLPTYLRK